MKILISNDDGVFAPGIAALVKAFSAAGHEVLVCAPDSQRSAASHSLSIHREIPVRETALEGAARAWAIGGTPADCVKLGLMVLCPEAEAVVSGVNRGYNVGTDILYSGTVAAAMEGAICGRPALAVSQSEKKSDYAQASQMAVRAFETMMRHPLPPVSVLNLNYPDCKEAKALVTAEMGCLHYDEVYTPQRNEQGEISYMLSGAINDEKTHSDDYSRLCEGFATLTVLNYDMADRRSTEALKDLIEG